MSGWTEALHPRDKKGEFAHGEGWVGKLSDRIGDETGGDSSLEEGIASGRSGIPETLASGTQGTVFLVRFKNGTKAVQKIFASDPHPPEQDQIHAEELATRLARGLGLDAPHVVDDKGSLVMTHKEGDTLAGMRAELRSDDDKNALSRDVISSREGKILGLLDLAIGNTDRNNSNVIINGGKISPIDHGWAFSNTHDEVLKFGGNKFIDGVTGKNSVNYTKADIQHMQDVLESLRSEFESRGREDWFNNVMDSLKRMRRSAKGTENLF